MPYDVSGFKTTPIEIPDKEIKIIICSNFNYGKQSYLYALIKCKGYPLLDFSKEKIRILNNSSLSMFSVTSGDWETLYRKIVRACNESIPKVCPVSAIEYVDELNRILENDYVEIKGVYHESKTIKWETNLLVSLLVGDRLIDLIDSLQRAQIEDEVLNEHILLVCRHYLHKIKEVNVDVSDNHTNRLAKALNYVCNFMLNHGKGIEFLTYYQSATGYKA